MGESEQCGGHESGSERSAKWGGWMLCLYLSMYHVIRALQFNVYYNTCIAFDVMFSFFVDFHVCNVKISHHVDRIIL